MKKFLFFFLVLLCVVVKTVSYVQDIQAQSGENGTGSSLNLNDKNSEKAFETYLEGTITAYQTNSKVIGNWSFYDRNYLTVLVVSKADMIEDSVFYNCFRECLVGAKT